MNNRTKKIIVVSGALVVLYLLYNQYNKELQKEEKKGFSPPKKNTKPQTVKPPQTLKPPQTVKPTQPQTEVFTFDMPTPTPPFNPVSVNTSLPPNMPVRDYSTIVLGDIDRENYNQR